MKHLPTIFALVVVGLTITAAEAQQHWPGFLGAGHTPIAEDSIPVTWSSTENVAWKTVTPGYGQSSPVIWSDHVYLTSVAGANKETLHVVCCSLISGKVLWDKSVPSTYPEKNSVYISRAAPTPVVDDEGVYACFESGDVVALSHAGDLRWTISLSGRHGPPKNKFGLSASPTQLADRLIILMDDEGPSYLTAIAKKDGSELWRTDRTARMSWSSPMLITTGETQQIVCSSGGSIDGYDPKTGKQIWTFTEVAGNSNTSPTLVADGTVLIAASPGRDGRNSQLAKQSNGMFDIANKKEGGKPGFRWTNATPTPSWGSPIVHRGFAYWVNRSGVVYCLNGETGESVYTERIKQSCWATPVGIGNRIYFFGKAGMTTVLTSGNEFQVVAQNRLWEDDAPPVNNVPTAPETTEERRVSAAMFSNPIVYGVAIVDGRIVLRTGSTVFCIHSDKPAAANTK